MKKANEFMLLFRFNPSSDFQPSQADLEAQHQLWSSFIGNLAIQEKLVSTHQLGFEGTVVHADGNTTEGIAISDNQTIGGNLVVLANSIHEAVEISKGCPILVMGGNVEVRSIMPME